MKCDVCQTLIPLGSHTCPNCGYSHKVNHIQTYSKLKNRTQPPQRKAKKTLFSRTQLFLIVLMTLCFFIVLSVITSLSIRSDRSSLESMSFDEALDSEHDDGTISVASEYKEDLYSFLRDELELESFLPYEGITIDEYNEEAISAIVHAEGMDHNTRYELAATFQEGNLNLLHLSLSGELAQSIEKYEMFKDNEKVQKIGNYMGIENLYQVIYEAREYQMTTSDEENGWAYEVDNMSIYLSEEYDNHAPTPHYNYYCDVIVQY